MFSYIQKREFTEIDDRSIELEGKTAADELEMGSSQSEYDWV